MTKYIVTVYKPVEGAEVFNITTTTNEVDFTSFPAEVGNPNYDAFLVQAELTDTQVKALKPDTWYDFPKETK